MVLFFCVYLEQKLIIYKVDVSNPCEVGEWGIGEGLDLKYINEASNEQEQTDADFGRVYSVTDWLGIFVINYELYQFKMVFNLRIKWFGFVQVERLIDTVIDSHQRSVFGLIQCDCG